MDQQQAIDNVKKHVLYVCFLLVLFCFQEAPSVNFFGIKFLLAIDFAIAIAIIEKENVALIYGIVTGLLCDTYSPLIFGMRSFVVIFVVCVISYLIDNHLKDGIKTAIYITGASEILYVLFGYVFQLAIWGYEHKANILIRYYFPSIIISTAMQIPIYKIVKKISLIYFEDNE